MTFTQNINYGNVPLKEVPKLVFYNFTAAALPLALPLPSVSNLTNVTSIANISNVTNMTAVSNLTGNTISVPPMTFDVVFSQFFMFVLFFILLFSAIQRQVRSSIRIVIKQKDNPDYVIAIVNYMARLPTIRHLVFNGNFYVSYDQQHFQITDHVYGRFMISDDENCVLDINSDVFTVSQLRSFLDKIYMDSVKKDTNQYLYTPRVSNHSSIRFEKNKFNTELTLSSIFNKNIQSVIDQVRFFINNKKWYHKMGFPYTLGVLIHGPSGCGKTSVIKAVAKESGRNIITVSLNKKTTYKQLFSLFFDEHIHVYDERTKQTKLQHLPFHQRMYLFENIDQLTSKQFSFVKELLYGVLETPERFIVFTADDIKSVHSSLLSAGRIDKTIYLDYCDVDTIVDMISSFYETNVEDYEAYKISLRDNVLTPSTLYEILFRNITNQDGALNEISDMCKLELVENEEISDHLKEEITSMISDELEEESSTEDKVETKPITESVSSDDSDFISIKPKIKDIELVDLKTIHNNKKEVQTDVVQTVQQEVQTNLVETEQKEVQTESNEPIKQVETEESVSSISLDGELSDSDFSDTIDHEGGLTQSQFLKGISVISSMSEKIKKSSIIVDDFFTNKS